MALRDHLNASLILDADANPDPARTHSSKLLLPLRDTRELLQTPMRNTLSPTHLPTNNLHSDGQGSREDGKSGKTGAAEGAHERGRNRTAEDCGVRECRQRAALGAEQRALVQRDPRQQRRVQAELLQER